MPVPPVPIPVYRLLYLNIILFMGTLCLHLEREGDVRLFKTTVTPYILQCIKKCISNVSLFCNIRIIKSFFLVQSVIKPNQTFLHQCPNSFDTGCSSTRSTVTFDVKSEDITFSLDGQCCNEATKDATKRVILFWKVQSFYSGK
jgi:hypothetical protein